MKGIISKTKRHAVTDIAAYCGWTLLVGVGLTLLLCDIADGSALVREVGYLFAFVLVKGAAILVLWLCSLLYRRYTGKSMEE